MRVAAFTLSACMLATSAFAQGIYSTRDNPTPPLARPQAPQQQPGLPDPRQLYAPQIPSNTRGMLTPAPARPQFQSPQTRGVPFGRASAEAVAPVPRGPRSTAAAPVDDIDAGELDFLTDSGIISEELPPPVETTSEPAAPQITLYEEEDPSNPVRAVRLRALHKVTAKVEELEVALEEPVRFGQLAITPRSCRVAEAEFQPDSAAMVEVIEFPSRRYDVAQVTDGVVMGDVPAWQQPRTEQGKPIFSGWMFSSSPSINGLEHPVYDVRLVGCVLANEQGN